MKPSRASVYSSGTSSRSTSSPTTPLLKRQRRIIDESPLSQSEVCWMSELSPQRSHTVRAKSSNQLTQTPVRIVKRHVSSPAIGTFKVKNLFDFDNSIPELDEETKLKREDSFSMSDEEFDFSDDQLLAVLKKVDEEEQLQAKFKIKSVHPAVSAVVDINFEDSFDDAILASIPLEELSKCDKGNIEIFYNDGLSQIVEKASSVKVLSKNKSMEPKQNHQNEPKKFFERHNSLPHQPLANSTNGKFTCYSKYNLGLIGF